MKAQVTANERTDTNADITYKEHIDFSDQYVLFPYFAIYLIMYTCSLSIYQMSMEAFESLHPILRSTSPIMKQKRYSMLTPAS